MANEVEEIKQRLDLAEVIGGYLPLVKAGGVNLKGRCPFHAEKTPSFHVSRDKQMWHCFGCGEGGDVFSFLMKIEGMDFKEALKSLADRAGVVLPEYRPEEASERERVRNALSLATRFYAAVLTDAPQGARGRAYLAERGVSDEMRKTFALGVAPDSWDALQLALAKKGVRPDDMEKAGLVVRRERGSGHYDRFRDRLMFPITDAQGAVVGFTGRVLAPDAKEAKYVNTPQTILYNKSAAIYGIDLARTAIRDADQAVVVEGNMDVIACHQFGMPNVVAASGTALTGDQLRVLGRYTQTVAIAFDADAAGEKAARRGIDLAVAAGFTVRVIEVPPGCGKDPDECVRKDAKAWAAAVSGANHIMEYLFRRTAHGKDLSDPTEKKRVGNALLSEIAKLPDPIEHGHWLQKLSAMLAVQEEILREQLMKKTVEGRRSAVGSAPADRRPPTADRLPAPSRHRLLSESFIAFVYGKPEFADAAIAAVPARALADEETRGLYEAAVAGYTQTGQFPTEAASAATSALLRALMLSGERDYASLERSAAEEELRTLSDGLREQARSRELSELRRDMQEAERRQDVQKVRELESRIRELMSSR